MMRHWKKLRYSVEMKRYNNIQDLLTKIEKTQKVKFLIQEKKYFIFVQMVGNLRFARVNLEKKIPIIGDL